jgi:hypothetical protein
VTGFFVLLRFHLVRGEEPCPDRPVTDPKSCGDLSQAVTFRLQLQNSLAVHGSLWPTEILPIRSRIPNPCTHSLPNQISLKLCHGGHESEERLPQHA